MAWLKLNSFDALNELIQKSNKSPQLLFKHSTRCSMSAFALNRIQPVLKNNDLYILDVIANRDLSNQVANLFNITHQSPQLLIVDRGTCIHATSHIGISAENLVNQLNILESKP